MHWIGNDANKCSEEKLINILRKTYIDFTLFLKHLKFMQVKCNYQLLAGFAFYLSPYISDLNRMLLEKKHFTETSMVVGFGIKRSFIYFD